MPLSACADAGARAIGELNTTSAMTNALRCLLNRTLRGCLPFSPGAPHDLDVVKLISGAPVAAERIG